MYSQYLTPKRDGGWGIARRPGAQERNGKGISFRSLPAARRRGRSMGSMGTGKHGNDQLEPCRRLLACVNFPRDTMAVWSLQEKMRQKERTKGAGTARRVADNLTSTGAGTDNAPRFQIALRPTGCPSFCGPDQELKPLGFTSHRGLADTQKSPRQSDHPIQARLYYSSPLSSRCFVQ